jgi:hypothetical protein
MRKIKIILSFLLLVSLRTYAQSERPNILPAQPFLVVFNIVSHERSIHKRQDSLRHDPDKVTLPPLHPPTPEMRQDWAQYYDRVETMDQQVGKLLRALEEQGPAVAAAEALYSTGEKQAGVDALVKALDHPRTFVSVQALNVLQYLGDEALPPLARARALIPEGPAAPQQDNIYDVRAAHASRHV